MGKRRNTAKTGDKAIYGSRQSSIASERNAEEDHPMHNEIDRFHNDRDQDYLRLEDDRDKLNADQDDDGISGQQGVMDLGARGDSDSSDEESSQDSSVGIDEKGQANPQDDLMGPGQEEDEEESSDSESEEEADDQQLSDPRNWGRKKSSYYHGDTADLEIGQDEEDAFVEEEAAREVQHSRFDEMDEDDFVLSGEEDDSLPPNRHGDTANSQEKLVATRDTSKLSAKEKRKLMNKQHPELIPVVSHFSDVVKELKNRTQVATKALTQADNTAETVGASSQGQQYLLTKSLLQNSVALNTVMFLLLKSENELEDIQDTSVEIKDANHFQAHPVMAQLKQCHSIIQKFEASVETQASDIDEQLDNLVKAASLMLSSDQTLSEEESDHANKNESQVSKHRANVDIKEPLEGLEVSTNDSPKRQEKEAGQGRSQRILNEARFGLRPHEIKLSTEKSAKKRTVASISDFGDLDRSEVRTTPKSFASTINAIEQRSATESRKRRQAQSAEQLFDPEAEDDQLAQGLKMMEEELGKLESSENEGEGDPIYGDGDSDVEVESDSDLKESSLEFYDAMAKRSKDKKSRKKSLYEVAPKFPGSESEVHGERAISKAILKNRGLVAHKAKINRNPRVKKREQYRKALIRRKGAVREVRTDEGHQYGGEGTGIKSGISRSRKLASK